MLYFTWFRDRMIVHFNLNMFRPSELKRVKISLACVFAFMGIGWPLIVYKAGILGWIKFWLMPFLGYHFWVTLLPIPLCFNFIAVLSMHCCCFEPFLWLSSLLWILFFNFVWFYRWAHSRWYTILRLIYLSKLRMSGMLLRLNLMEQCIVITPDGILLYVIWIFNLTWLQYIFLTNTVRQFSQLLLEILIYFWWRSLRSLRSILLKCFTDLFVHPKRINWDINGSYIDFYNGSIIFSTGSRPSAMISMSIYHTTYLQGFQVITYVQLTSLFKKTGER